MSADYEEWESDEWDAIGMYCPDLDDEVPSPKTLECPAPGLLEALGRVLHVDSLQISDHVLGGPTKILDGLYLGNMHDAENILQLHLLGISAVLCCAEGAGADYPSSISFLEVPGLDQEAYPMLTDLFEKARTFVDGARDEGRGVLVHCVAGSNRAGVVAVAYLMVSLRWGLIQAAEWVFHRRPFVLQNQGFQRQLVQFGVDRGLLDEVDGLHDPVLRLRQS